MDIQNDIKRETKLIVKNKYINIIDVHIRHITIPIINGVCTGIVIYVYIM